MMDSTDKIWQTFNNYYNLLGRASSEAGMDLFGTDIRNNITANLTVCYFLNQLNETLKKRK